MKFTICLMSAIGVFAGLASAMTPTVIGAFAGVVSALTPMESASIIVLQCAQKGQGVKGHGYKTVCDPTKKPGKIAASHVARDVDESEAEWIEPYEGDDGVQARDIDESEVEWMQPYVEAPATAEI